MNTNIASIIVASVYFIIKFIELRLMKKEKTPIKFLLKDVIIVYACCMGGLFLYSHIEPLTNGIASSQNVFVNEPNF